MKVRLKNYWQFTLKPQLAKFKSPFVILFFIILLAECFSFIYMLYWGLTTSLKSRNDFGLNLFGPPAKVIFANFTTSFEKLYVEIPYGAGMRRVMFTELLFNSLVIAVGWAVISVFSRLAVAYVVCKYPMRFNKVMHFIVVFSIVVPTIGSLGASLNFLRVMGYYDNLPLLLLGAFQFADSGMLIWYGVWRGIPGEYMEAARVDGAGHWRTLLTIMLPMVRVPLMILLVLGFIGYWNAYMIPFTQLPSKPTLALSLWYFQSSSDNEINSIPMQMAAAMIVSFPCIVLFLIFQRGMVGNLTAGGLKG